MGVRLISNVGLNDTGAFSSGNCSGYVLVQGVAIAAHEHFLVGVFLYLFSELYPDLIKIHRLVSHLITAVLLDVDHNNSGFAAQGCA